MRIQAFKNFYPGRVPLFQLPDETGACQLVTTDNVLGIDSHLLHLIGIPNCGLPDV